MVETGRWGGADYGVMSAKTLGCWLAVCAVAAAGPGELDRHFKPELRAWVSPWHVTIGPDGRAWVGGGFDRADGESTGDLVRLGKNGGVADEPAPGYLGKNIGISSGGGYAYVPFPLANGDVFLPGRSGGWLRMDAQGRSIGKGFPGTGASEAVTPLFERDGKLWDIRRFADGRRVLERRRDDRRMDGGFSLAINDALAAVPAPDDSVWVLAGPDDRFSFSGTPVTRRVMRVDGVGNIVGEPRIISVARNIDLVAGPAGDFRLVFGPLRSQWNFWPRPTSTVTRIEWFSATGELERGQDFHLPIFASFSWAESADGSFVATDARREYAGGYFVTDTANLRRYGADGAEDTTFQTPGPVGTARALADGKWLVDGLRRLNPDGSVDETWTEPELTRPANVGALASLSGGRVLAAGNFGTADGLIRNRLVVFLKSGKVDPRFVADERIGEWKSVAVVKNEIYVVTVHPVEYGNDVRSNLVRLRSNGTLDESYEPMVPGSSWSASARFQTVDNAVRVAALNDGGVLVETLHLAGDIFRAQLVRLNPDGSRDMRFRGGDSYNGFSAILPLAKGGYVGDGVIYRQDGRVKQDVAGARLELRPLCEWLGGVVFLDFRQGSRARLRLWAGNRWVPWFRPQTIAGATDAVVAEPDRAGGLFVAASWTAGRPELRRLTLLGRPDRFFRAPAFGNRERQESGGWWKAEDGRRVRFNTKAEEKAVSPRALLWQPGTRRLWTGGDFNVAGGKPRDGLARLVGGFR